MSDAAHNINFIALDANIVASYQGFLCPASRHGFKILLCAATNDISVFAASQWEQDFMETEGGPILIENPMGNNAPNSNDKNTSWTSTVDHVIHNSFGVKYRTTLVTRPSDFKAILVPGSESACRVIYGRNDGTLIVMEATVEETACTIWNSNAVALLVDPTRSREEYFTKPTKSVPVHLAPARGAVVNMFLTKDANTEEHDGTMEVDNEDVIEVNNEVNNSQVTSTNHVGNSAESTPVKNESTSTNVQMSPDWRYGSTPARAAVDTPIKFGREFKTPVKVTPVVDDDLKPTKTVPIITWRPNYHTASVKLDFTNLYKDHSKDDPAANHISNVSKVLNPKSVPILSDAIRATNEPKVDIAVVNTAVKARSTESRRVAHQKLEAIRAKEKADRIKAEKRKREQDEDKKGPKSLNHYSKIVVPDTIGRIQLKPSMKVSIPNPWYRKQVPKIRNVAKNRRKSAPIRSTEGFSNTKGHKFLENCNDDATSISKVNNKHPAATIPETSTSTYIVVPTGIKSIISEDTSDEAAKLKQEAAQLKAAKINATWPGSHSIPKVNVDWATKRNNAEAARAALKPQEANQAPAKSTTIHVNKTRDSESPARYERYERDERAARNERSTKKGKGVKAKEEDARINGRSLTLLQQSILRRKEQRQRRK